MLNYKDCCFLFFVVFLIPLDAYSYIDGGSFVFVIQFVAAGIAGALLMAKSNYSAIVSFFKKYRIPKTSEDPAKREKRMSDERN